MKRFLLLYIILAGTGLVLLKLPFMQSFIDAFCWFLAQVCGILIHLFDDGISLKDTVLRHGTNGFALDVTSECSGLSATWLLLAAVLAWTGTWKTKAIGVVAGIFIIQGLNVLRLISLLYLGDWQREWFDMIHEYLWPLLLHISVLLSFVLWLDINIKRDAHRSLLDA